MSDIEEVPMPQVISKGKNKGKVNTKDNEVFQVEFLRELAKLTRKDVDDYKGLTGERSQGTYKTVTNFFEDRCTSKINFYQEEMETLKQSFDQQKQIQKSNKAELRSCLKDIQRQEIVYQDHTDKILTHISLKEVQHVFFRIWKAYINQVRFRRTIVNFCTKFRGVALKERTFHSWKHSFKRDGIDAKIKRQYEIDLNGFKEGYLSIIATLQTSIKNAEDQIKRKRASRKDFSYNLSRNLLKTISNLSMEVVNLNQFAIKDKEVTNELGDMNVLIKNKMKELEKMKVALRFEEDEGPVDDANIISN